MSAAVVSRRAFLQGAGALVVGFTVPSTAFANRPSSVSFPTPFPGATMPPWFSSWPSIGPLPVLIVPKPVTVPPSSEPSEVHVSFNGIRYSSFGLLLLT